MTTTPVALRIDTLPARWYKLRDVPEQMGYVRSPHRFNAVPAGRRSGKTERFKRKLIRRALFATLAHNEPPRYFAAAPTRDQAKRIYWEDLKALSKPWWASTPLESSLTIELINAAQISVIGMDKPQRMEGTPWDGGGLDEVANMRPDALSANVLPALTDRSGWLDLLGVPEGRNHFYDVYKTALASMQALGDASPWGAFTWVSAAVLPPAEIALMRSLLDERMFAQEFEASFVNFEGRAYYGWQDDNAVAGLRARYDPRQPLIIMLDFNVAPGVAAIGQEMPTLDRATRLRLIGPTMTGIIGEVWIDNNSNTDIVCRRILHDWSKHTGRVEVYGDASGGARGTAKVSGSDWELARRMLTAGDSEYKGFGNRVTFHVKPANPPERSRVNAVNTRLRSATGLLHLQVDPVHAPHVVKDFEGVVTVKGGSGEIDENANKMLNHISSAVGYYVEYEFPLKDALVWGASQY